MDVRLREQCYQKIPRVPVADLGYEIQAPGVVITLLTSLSFLEVRRGLSRKTGHYCQIKRSIGPISSRPRFRHRQSYNFLFSRAARENNTQASAPAPRSRAHAVQARVFRLS